VKNNVVPKPSIFAAYWTLSNMWWWWDRCFSTLPCLPQPLATGAIMKTTKPKVLPPVLSLLRKRGWRRRSKGGFFLFFLEGTVPSSRFKNRSCGGHKAFLGGHHDSLRIWWRRPIVVEGLFEIGKCLNPKRGLRGVDLTNCSPNR